MAKKVTGLTAQTKKELLNLDKFYYYLSDVEVHEFDLGQASELFGERNERSEIICKICKKLKFKRKPIDILAHVNQHLKIKSFNQLTDKEQVQIAINRSYHDMCKGEEEDEDIRIAIDRSKVEVASNTDPNNGTQSNDAIYDHLDNLNRTELTDRDVTGDLANSYPTNDGLSSMNAMNDFESGLMNHSISNEPDDQIEVYNEEQYDDENEDDLNIESLANFGYVRANILPEFRQDPEPIPRRFREEPIPAAARSTVTSSEQSTNLFRRKRKHDCNEYPPFNRSAARMAIDLETDERHARRSSTTIEFREPTEKDAQLEAEFEQLLGTCSPEQRELRSGDLNGFQKLYTKFTQGHTTIDWNKIEPLPDRALIDHRQLERPEGMENIKAMLNKLVVVKLNGGLGTSMGYPGPMSLITVRNDLTFLDLTVQQVEHLNQTYDTDVPLVLMNSVDTDDQTRKVLRKYKDRRVKIYTFLQSRYPRIHRETLMPIARDLNDDSWYPPGHGDFYESFVRSGLLNNFQNDEREYLFASNIDNLAATVDLNILNILLTPSSSPKPHFIMELTDRTNADLDGGRLIQYEGRLRLLEIAQVPKQRVAEFKSAEKFTDCNTNNLWIKLNAIDQVVKANKLDIDVIANHKHLSGCNVIQLETAIGAALHSFENSICIRVPRSRFLPVKKTQDLLLVMSNLYDLNNGTLLMNPNRRLQTVPLVKLDDVHFGKVHDFMSRFDTTIPDMLNLDHLKVSGDVTFGRDVVLVGTVMIIANHGQRIDIPAGAILADKIVSGNLRVSDV